MGLNINTSGFSVTNSNGETKFALDRRMPHILISQKGSVTLSTLFAGNPSATSIERTDEYTLVTDSRIKDVDYFFLPFFKISGGYSDTAGYTVSGTGSTLIRFIKQPGSGELLGTSILTPEVQNGSIKLILRHTFNRAGYANVEGDVAASLTYRIYYGRFS